MHKGLLVPNHNPDTFPDYFRFGGVQLESRVFQNLRPSIPGRPRGKLSDIILVSLQLRREVVLFINWMRDVANR